MELERGGLELIERWRSSRGALWIDLERPRLSQEDQALLRALGCHPLAIKDAMRERHPPKLERFRDHHLLIFRGLRGSGEQLKLETVQLTIVIAERLLITIRSGPMMSAQALLDEPELASLIAQPRQLALALMHHCAGLYVDSLLSFEEELQALEDQLLKTGRDELLQGLMSYRARLRRLYRVFCYHFELTRELSEHWSEEGDGELKHHIRDLYDRCERLQSLSHQQYEICGDLIDGYLSLSSHELNQTMKMLTAVTLIFVPLSFLAGLYGMNFEHMPELHYRYAYWVLLTVMLSIAGLMSYAFRRRGWL